MAEQTEVLLRKAGVAHAVIEGDLLDQVHSAPPDDPWRTEVTRADLAALWATYGGARPPPPHPHQHGQRPGGGDADRRPGRLPARCG
ncbi:hypothetical protein KQH42_24305 [Streptomyces sp. CHA1]|uniref:hypothetical protein n=1 Tax=unclassified Streptomyces TaxID=2593676 RepID=UPI000A96119F|nr:MULTISPECIES: hypothetical protein [unclassified Streptomyces]MBT3155927.1 hypothetical protein [Streptomyces sp. G11C]MCO6703677.1 hypothetical protein [Streptomyces sp. CHB9.2]MCO6709889.1 hypothetical protein [Streptomyces sp. CHA3]MCO6715634.1 hypothetical protein [Streptomyces sp. CHB19.2]MCO6721764.1 hypothetical protein [Streptomyces sp. Vc714c-19]